MSEYVLGHELEGERARLALMSRLLDPLHRRLIESLGIGPGARTLEVGCGNGSISAWLAERVIPEGHAVAFDLDLSLIEMRAPALELRQGDIVAGPVDPGGFDLVTARAVLHHVADIDTAIENLAASVAPGGAILLIEPDFLPVSVAEPQKSGRSGRDGLRGRASAGSTTTSVARWHPGSRLWASRGSPARPKQRFTTVDLSGLTIGPGR